MSSSSANISSPPTAEPSDLPALPPKDDLEFGGDRAESDSAGNIDTEPTSESGNSEDTSHLIASTRVLSSTFALLLRWTVAGNTSAWLSSAMVHMVAVLVLSLLVYRHQFAGPPIWLDATLEEAPISDVMDLESELLVTSTTSPSESSPSESVLPTSVLPVGSANSTSVVRIVPPTLETSREDGETQAAAIPIVEAIAEPLRSHGGGMQGRTFGNRYELAMQGGGTPASEKAVEDGLAWLAAINGKMVAGDSILRLRPCVRVNAAIRGIIQQRPHRRA